MSLASGPPCFSRHNRIIHYSLYFLLTVCVANCFQCHVYDQPLQGDCLSWNSLVSGAIQIANCDYCIAYVRDDKFVSGCVQDRQSVILNDDRRNVCLSISDKEKATNKTVFCQDEKSASKMVCCCADLNCFDKLRNKFSKSDPPTTSTCYVFRREYSEIRDGIMGTATNTTFVRKSCAVCKAQKDQTGIAFSCVENKEVDYQCEENDQFKGGSLACNREETECCCKGDSCIQDFLNYFNHTSGHTMPPSRISRRYSDEKDSVEKEEETTTTFRPTDLPNRYACSTDGVFVWSRAFTIIYISTFYFVYFML
ncbi:hypothetical protein Ddc_03429 [Ditylenchus destructor]|nr:hypothetical protein Ddc_03429 [Ditylenchus destructor]